MSDLFDDPRWDTYGLLKEAYLAVESAIHLDLHVSDQPIRFDVYDLLIRLARSTNHCLRPGEISKGLSISPSSTTRMIDHAESLTFVSRKPDPDDRRAYLVALTDSGLSEMESWASASLESSVRHTSDHLTKADTKRFESMLRVIRDRAQRHLAEYGSK